MLLDNRKMSYNRQDLNAQKINYFRMSLLIYDNKCYLCEKFSRIVRRLSHWTIAVIGHHTEQGISIKSK